MGSPPPPFPAEWPYRLRQFEQSRRGLEVASIEDDSSGRGRRGGPRDRNGMGHLASHLKQVTRQ
jgi:hypothetical protein